MATLENTGPFLRSQRTATGATDADASEGAAKIEAGSWMLPQASQATPWPPSQDTLSVMVPQSFSTTRERTSPYHKERTNERLHMASWGWTRRCFAGALGLATRGSRPDAKNPKILWMDGWMGALPRASKGGHEVTLKLFEHNLHAKPTMPVTAAREQPLQPRTNPPSTRSIGSGPWDDPISALPICPRTAAAASGVASYKHGDWRAAVALHSKV
ncbi:hypothetical protein BGZ61DRAFT_554729 [Ilyonectria robusta]|uniref:uncharacterized protein n=1 Tax=Ilyonectria robusta TaxID=1079257 RepID=UPI001E8E8A28|nr:uncharacterized protein BGZ61DRAFT_554729 [Ilyonectria robusta]KAH8674917.1 hypothetical protein BGZ61DRAFT_554729 [Ilyonectria robusta]